MKLTGKLPCTETDELIVYADIQQVYSNLHTFSCEHEVEDSRSAISLEPPASTQIGTPSTSERTATVTVHTPTSSEAGNPSNGEHSQAHASTESSIECAAQCILVTFELLLTVHFFTSELIFTVFFYPVLQLPQLRLLPYENVAYKFGM